MGAKRVMELIEEIVFGGGVRTFSEIIRKRNIAIISITLPRKTMGIYLRKENCIIVNKKLKGAVVEYVLWHELLHAIFPEAPEEKIEEWSFYFTRRHPVNLEKHHLDLICYVKEE